CRAQGDPDCGSDARAHADGSLLEAPRPSRLMPRGPGAGGAGGLERSGRRLSWSPTAQRIQTRTEVTVRCRHKLLNSAPMPSDRTGLSASGSAFEPLRMAREDEETRATTSRRSGVG